MFKFDNLRVLYLSIISFKVHLHIQLISRTRINLSSITTPYTLACLVTNQMAGKVSLHTMVLIGRKRTTAAQVRMLSIDSFKYRYMIKVKKKVTNI